MVVWASHDIVSSAKAHRAGASFMNSTFQRFDGKWVKLDVSLKHIFLSGRSCVAECQQLQQQFIQYRTGLRISGDGNDDESGDGNDDESDDGDDSGDESDDCNYEDWELIHLHISLFHKVLGPLPKDLVSKGEYFEIHFKAVIRKYFPIESTRFPVF